MNGFVKIEFPKCSICLEGFHPENKLIAHLAGEQHPFHWDCLEEFIISGNQRDPTYGIQPIQCPVCRIVLPRSLTENPLQNPAPSISAANDQLAVPSPRSETSSSDLEPIDFNSLAWMIRKINEDFANGLMDKTSHDNYIDFLLRS